MVGVVGFLQIVVNEANQQTLKNIPRQSKVKKLIVTQIFGK
jgi:hypothetical protein